MFKRSVVDFLFREVVFGPDTPELSGLDTLTRDSHQAASVCPGGKDSKNLGIINDNGVRQASPHTIYVNDNLMADTRRRLSQALAAAIEAISVIMGRPHLAL